VIISKRNKSGILCYWDDVLNASKVKSPLEHIEQINLVAHSSRKWIEVAEMGMHVPNESNIPVQYRAKLSKCGLLPGASDWLILYPAHGRPYAAIELKRSRKRDSSISQEQVDFLLKAEEVGAFSCVAYGYVAAMQAISDYFNNSIDG